jgi:hypothetical protein
MSKPTPLTRERVAAHENLHARLSVLLKQLERVAARRPFEPVPAETLALASGLCREAIKLLGRAGRAVPVPQAGQAGKAGKSGTPGAGPDHAGLAALLGQALVELEGFEAAWSGHSATLGYAIWDVPGPALPVKRLLPRDIKPKKLEAQGEETTPQMREKLIHVILTRFAAGYDEGYAAAKEGKPPSATYAEINWDRLTERQQKARRRANRDLPETPIRYTNPPRELVPHGAVLRDPAERHRR